VLAKPINIRDLLRALHVACPNLPGPSGLPVN
jgi:hypothetical protein